MKPKAPHGIRRLKAGDTIQRGDFAYVTRWQRHSLASLIGTTIAADMWVFRNQKRRRTVKSRRVK